MKRACIIAIVVIASCILCSRAHATDPDATFREAVRANLIAQTNGTATINAGSITGTGLTTTGTATIGTATIGTSTVVNVSITTASIASRKPAVCKDNTTTYAIEIGTATNAQVVTFTTAFAAVPTVTFSDAHATSNSYASSPTASNFTAVVSTGTGRWMAIGAK